ncbi:hypothetical protein QD47_18720 [Paenibacillus terrae]|uniref:Uncharacterized protein n=1 Tax=Paenibacillus terrae TaxID=159743 RepID=A0A0D7X252_9BACL|nr:hypothetical protein QD47_18720 [Paenibacillus terrae]
MQFTLITLHLFTSDIIAFGVNSKSSDFFYYAVHQKSADLLTKWSTNPEANIIVYSVMFLSNTGYWGIGSGIVDEYSWVILIYTLLGLLIAEKNNKNNNTEKKI